MTARPAGPPLVTVIIPSHHQPKMLARAIRSVLNQTHPSLEIRVVDDGGNDEVRELVNSHPKVEYLTQKHLGAAQARNRGLNGCRGEYVGSLDHDDEWDPGYVERAVAILEEHQADLVWMNYRITGTMQVPNQYKRAARRSPTLSDAIEAPQLLDIRQAREFLALGGGPDSNSALVYRRHSLGPGWDTAVQQSDDWVLMVRLLVNAETRCVIEPKISWTKHEHGQNLSKWTPESGRRKLHDIDHAIRSYAAAYPAEVQKALRMHLGDHAYRLAYHLLWGRQLQEAGRHLYLALRTAGVRPKYFRFVFLLLLRLVARAMGIPPRSEWNDRVPTD